MGDNPRILIKIIAVGDLWKDGSLIGLNNGTFFLLFLVYIIKNTIVLVHLLVEGEDITDFDFAQFITVVLVVVVGVHLEVKH